MVAEMHFMWTAGHILSGYKRTTNSTNNTIYGIQKKRERTLQDEISQDSKNDCIVLKGNISSGRLLKCWNIHNRSHQA
jgi:hypothetical protein